MKEDIGGAGVLGRFACEALLPMTIAGKKLPDCVASWAPLEPLRNGRFVEMDEDAFSELLDCRQPVGVTGDRRAANGQLNVFDVAIRCGRRRLETREPVEARHLPQAMHGDEVLDCGEVDPGIRICPNVARKRLRVELCGRIVVSDFRPPARESIELG